jgi:hypothetical protein
LAHLDKKIKNKVLGS